jgi:hypothetical protein
MSGLNKNLGWIEFLSSLNIPIMSIVECTRNPSDDDPMFIELLSKIPLEIMRLILVPGLTKKYFEGFTSKIDAVPVHLLMELLNDPEGIKKFSRLQERETERRYALTMARFLSFCTKLPENLRCGPEQAWSSAAALMEMIRENNESGALQTLHRLLMTIFFHQRSWPPERDENFILYRFLIFNHVTVIF